jgi:hypothetical protein
MVICSILCLSISNSAYTALLGVVFSCPVPASPCAPSLKRYISEFNCVYFEILPAIVPLWFRELLPERFIFLHRTPCQLFFIFFSVLLCRD